MQASMLFFELSNHYFDLTPRQKRGEGKNVVLPFRAAEEEAAKARSKEMKAREQQEKLGGQNIEGATALRLLRPLLIEPLSF